ncbi:MAG TPA: glycine--tRNA ligase [Pseudomonadales bacterium]|nr:glycine--tRNA ligase [Pseudomonadales bacterium]
MSEPKENPLMEKIVSLCKRRGFIFQSSEIYGGINGFWDYGPLGAELKRNVKELWWTTMTRQRDDVVGLEATIIMSPKIWRASGHVDTFADLMVECPLTNKRYRADQVEPQSGIVYYYTGATEDRAKYDAWLKEKNGRPALTHKDEETVSFSVLIPKGKPPESARKIASEFYSKSIQFPILQGERSEPVENTTKYSPDSGAQLTEARPFNLMFKTYVGPLESEENVAYLRPETAQAIFAQFKNVLETSRQKVPFGIAQIGKAFRNEVTPRNYTFRSREFEQMELEFFIRPDEAIEAISSSVATPASKDHPGEPQPNWGWQLWHQYWVEERIKFYGNIGLPRTTLEEYWQKPEELAHYARATVDILFKFPFGTQELEGIAARSDFDLSQHARFSGKPTGVFDDELKAAWTQLPKEKQDALWRSYYENRKKYLLKSGIEAEAAAKSATEDANGLAKGQYIPHVIEPSAGVDRLILALLCHAFNEDQAPDEKGNMETRVVLRFAPCIAPVKVAVFPLLKNKPDLVAKAKVVRDLLRPHMNVFYDEAGAIGRRYRRQDEIGTPFCVTIDFDTLGEKGEELKDTVTLRDRDTMKQERVKIAELLPFLLSKIR